MLEDTKALDFVIGALATHRITKLVIDDEITADLREKWFEKVGEPHETKLGYLATCPWCVSMYAGALLAVGNAVAPKTTRVVATLLAFSSVTGLIEEHS